MIILTGKSGSGKTTVAKELEKHGFKRTVTCTTRPKRPGEKDGVDYHFLSQAQFNKLESEGAFAETSHTGYHSYGSLKESYKDPKAVFILDPAGIENMIRKVGRTSLLIIYLDADRILLQRRLSNRGDSPLKIQERLAEEETKYMNMRNICDFSIVQRADTSAEQTALLISWIAKRGSQDAAS